MTSKNITSGEENVIPNLINSVYPSFALLAGMQLDLFTPLNDGPMSAEQLSNAIGVGPAKLKPLLYALVVAGVLNMEGEDFVNTEEANHCLVQGKTSCMVETHKLLSGIWDATLKTAESIRQGVPQAKYDYYTMSKDELERFLRGEHPYALSYGRELVKRLNLSSYQTLLDVGGGSGGLAIAVIEACPHIQATVVDLPTVTPVTEIFIDEAGANDKIQVEAVDVTRQALTGSYDVAVLSALLQALSPEEARRTIKNVSQVVKPGGAIYIRGAGIIDNSRISPPDLVGFNLVFINVYDEGQAYTENEHKVWLEEAGFGEIKRMILSDESSIITARKMR